MTVDPENQRQLTSVRGRLARLERRVQRYPAVDPPESIEGVRFEDAESRVDAVEGRLDLVEQYRRADEAT